MLHRLSPGERVLLLAVICIAIFSARPYAGGWNDGSRLAAVESLAEHGSFIIDESIFVRVPPDRSPYPPGNASLAHDGTKDKLLISGHFYSDKSPVPTVAMAAVAHGLHWLGLPAAVDRPDMFCLVTTIVTSGLAYLLAVIALLRIGRRVGLSEGLTLGVATVFAFGTTAMPYIQAVNNHILLLAVAAMLFAELLRPVPSMLVVGTLAGVGYSIDLAAGPMLLVCVVGLVLLTAVMRRGTGWLVLAAAPWLVLHHILNYFIGGTIGPANGVPEYLAWPGTPFNASNITGGWAHATSWKFVSYAGDMLVGKKGFLGHNLVLVLPLASLPLLVRTRYRERPIVLMGLAWAFGTWLLYAATSSNHSGACISIRWFVPLLVPGLLALIVVLREQPKRFREFQVLAVGSLIMGIAMALHGPWALKMVPGYWGIVGVTLLAWIVFRSRKPVEVEAISPDPFRLPAYGSAVAGIPVPGGWPAVVEASE